MPPFAVNPDAVHEFKDRAALERWYARHHKSDAELWIKIHKKGSGLASVTNVEGFETALCWGWIDAIRKPFDAQSFLQRYTPRKRGSIWSTRNQVIVARLTEEGRMQPAGQAEIDRAKADGRWERAYDGSTQHGVSARPPGRHRSGAQGARPLPAAQCAEPLLSRLPRPPAQDAGGPGAEDRGVCRDAGAWRDDLSQRQGQVMRYVAFLRGVNLGKRTVRSAELKAAIEDLGFSDVRTLLASGNVLFEARPSKGLKQKLELGLEEAFGFKIGVVLRSIDELKAMVAADPFGGVVESEAAKLHVRAVRRAGAARA